MRIVVIGSGISGLLAARRLCTEHEVTVFEAGPWIGGHTNTVRVPEGDHEVPVDTGFIVHNTRNYPGFTALMDELGCATQDSDMSFSVQSSRTGLEWKGSTDNTLGSIFAQRKNLFRPTFLRMLKDILRFNREAPGDLATASDSLTLGAYLEDRRYGRPFIEQYIVPMGAAVWSAIPSMLLKFPARYFVRFFENHGFLQLKGRPVWRVLVGGSSAYIDPLIAPFRNRVHVNTPVRSLARRDDGVEVCLDDAAPLLFDAAVVATHSDQALRLLADPTSAELDVLGSIPYQANDTVLHTDARMMPETRRAWAAWNYHVPAGDDRPATVTYHMNHLQSLDGPVDYFVTLNRTEDIDPSTILRRFTYHHPVYTPETRRAQQQKQAINGVKRTWYCGAYWGYGFHEDGVQSALDVVQGIRGEAVHA
ncbi:MAG: FAD-dependent oxidoreductase [Planctomycetota bacterium]|nr:FAD-dependent oxidoreductase [Planctomycetota bacterium]